MFHLPPESGKAPQPQARSASVGERLSIDLLSVEELLALRAEIDTKLPIRSLKDLNMEHELVQQLVTVQHLQHSVLNDESVPANQRAQTSNAVAATLATLTKMQSDTYTSERLKKVEQILIDTLQTLPMEAQEAFLARYEAELGAQGA